MNHKERKERRERKDGMDDDMKRMCDQVRQIAYDIHVYHGNGYLEKVYENAFEHGLLVNFGSFRFEIRKFIRNRHDACPS